MGELVKEFDTEKLIKQNKEFTQIPAKAKIFKNPKSLDKFESDVRAISTEQGDLYVADIDGLFTHSEMGNILFNEKPYEIQKYVTWYRHGASNNFILASVSKTMYDKLIKGGYPMHFNDRFWNGISVLRKNNPQYKFIGVEQREQNEGVGDKYLQRSANIADPEDEFEKQYQQHRKTQTRDDQNGEYMGEIIYGGGENYGNIYKNPKSLENFEPDVRAVSDDQGNLYIAQLDYPGYHQNITDNMDVNIGSPYDSWDNITWHRIGDSNMFGLSISFMEFYKKQMEKESTKQEMFQRIKKVNDKNPNLVMMPFYWDYLTKKEVEPQFLEQYLKAFGKKGKLKNY